MPAWGGAAECGIRRYKQRDPRAPDNRIYNGYIPGRALSRDVAVSIPAVGKKLQSCDRWKGVCWRIIIVGGLYYAGGLHNRG